MARQRKRKPKRVIYPRFYFRQSIPESIPRPTSILDLITRHYPLPPENLLVEEEPENVMRTFEHLTARWPISLLTALLPIEETPADFSIDRPHVSGQGTS
jgi:hypothetical protein